MVQTNKINHFLVMGDGHRALIFGTPTETTNLDGIKTMVFELIPTEALKNKFKLVYPDAYSDLKNQTLLREYPIVDEIPLGNARVDYDLLKLAEYINRFSHVLKPMMGDKDFRDFKDLVDKLNKQYKYLKGVIEITKDPQAPFQYFCFNDLNGNITKASGILSAMSNTIKNQDKHIFSLEGKNARQIENVRIAGSEVLEHIKQNKQESNVLGEKRVYNTQQSQEEQAGQDQSYG